MVPPSWPLPVDWNDENNTTTRGTLDIVSCKLEHEIFKIIKIKIYFATAGFLLDSDRELENGVYDSDEMRTGKISNSPPKIQLPSLMGEILWNPWRQSFFTACLIYVRGKRLPVIRVGFEKLRVSALKCGTAGSIKCKSGGSKKLQRVDVQGLYLTFGVENDRRQGFQRISPMRDRADEVKF